MAVVDYARPLALIDVPEPALEPGYALVGVLACGLCFSDVKTSRGEMPFSDELRLPHVPGHEVCGRVLATSPDGAFPVGELVVVHQYWPCGRCRSCLRGRESLCTDLEAWMGFTHPGGFQERLTVPLDRLFRVPDGIDPTHAAPLTCALGTAYRATVTRGRVKAGTTACVIGLGGVGIHALQVVDAVGSQARGLDVSERAVEVARGLGLDAARIGDGQLADRRPVDGFDVVIVTAGAAAAYATAAELVGRGGRIVCVGYARSELFQLPLPRLVLDEVEVVGSRYVSRDELAAVIELVHAGRVRPIVDSVRPLEDANEAIADLVAGAVVGRTVLRVGAT
jgi:D-arabinose 1-dehydrogenase-like Zn-dependent alcohol dehydrogenase